MSATNVFFSVDSALKVKTLGNAVVPAIRHTLATVDTKLFGGRFLAEDGLNFFAYRHAIAASLAIHRMIAQRGILGIEIHDTRRPALLRALFHPLKLSQRRFRSRQRSARSEKL